MAAKKRNRKGQFAKGGPGGPGRPRKQPAEEPARPATRATRQPQRRRPDPGYVADVCKRADAMIRELEALLRELTSKLPEP